VRIAAALTRTLSPRRGEGTWAAGIPRVYAGGGAEAEVEVEKPSLLSVRSTLALAVTFTFSARKGRAVTHSSRAWATRVGVRSTSLRRILARKPGAAFTAATVRSTATRA